jgi:hypothetical protein
MTNPVDEFLLEKRALSFSGLAGAAKPVGRSAGVALGMGAGAAAFGGMAMLGHKAYLAATKTRDFNSMMEANPDLHEHNKSDPSGFTRLFTSLRTFAPEFTRDPMVAGAYMRRGMESPVENRGMLGVEAMGAMKPQRPHPVVEEAMGGFREGMKSKGQKFSRDAAENRPAPTEETQQVYG